MAKRRGDWRGQLTKGEKRHLREDAGIYTKYALMRTLKFQAESDHGCHVCKAIGRKVFGRTW